MVAKMASVWMYSQSIIGQNLKGHPIIIKQVISRLMGDLIKDG